jgi:TetR/AcrR family transcriptional regulator, multidrug resistance operon repressor
MRPRDENKLLILKQKAIEMMVCEGFEGLSMQKLAKSAEISPATIYIHYASREEMVNSLHSEVMEVFSKTVLKNFSPDLDLHEGLWIQWKNRTEFALTYPLYYNFLQQFRNSTLVRCDHSEFKNNMKAFVNHAIEHGEMPEMPTEVFWSLAYGPLYALLDFHFNKKSVSEQLFQITDEILKSTFDRCILSLNSPTL